MIAIGLHCSKGSGQLGIPFTGCDFRTDLSHRPNISNCRLKSTESWELDDTSNCKLDTYSWGEHIGAGPGGECVLFVQERGYSMNIIYTIYGTLTPDMIANAGNTFCQKPPPPGQTCAITVPSVIDHELIKTTDHSVVAIDGTVNCGAAPLLEIIGGGKINLAPGLYTLITPEMIGEDRIRLTSTLTAIKAEPGDYAGIAIVIASPY